MLMLNHLIVIGTVVEVVGKLEEVTADLRTDMRKPEHDARQSTG